MTSKFEDLYFSLYDLGDTAGILHGSDTPHSMLYYAQACAALSLHWEERAAEEPPADMTNFTAFNAHRAFCRERAAFWTARSADWTKLAVRESVSPSLPPFPARPSEESGPTVEIAPRGEPLPNRLRPGFVSECC